MTEESLGCEIRATMDTVVIAHTAAGTPVHLDANAAAADRFLPVNRIKPHTCFKGPIESGCMKMAVVGFGKRPGAFLVHSCGPVEMRDRLLDACAAIKSTGRLLGGIGSIESTSGDVVRVEGLTADDVGGEFEHELTEYARSLVPALPFDEIDVLIVELGGKDISGTTIDPNVTGRFWVNGLDDLQKPRVERDRAARPHRRQRRQRARHRLRRLHPRLARQQDRLPPDLHQLLHRRPGRHAPVAAADGAARRGVVHQGRADDVRPRAGGSRSASCGSSRPCTSRSAGSATRCCRSAASSRSRQACCAAYSLLRGAPMSWGEPLPGRAPRPRRDAGVTLIEILIAIVLLAGVIAGTMAALRATTVERRVAPRPLPRPRMAAERVRHPVRRAQEGLQRPQADQGEQSVRAGYDAVIDCR